jgi:hypothetical protein
VRPLGDDRERQRHVVAQFGQSQRRHRLRADPRGPERTPEQLDRLGPAQPGQ